MITEPGIPAGPVAGKGEAVRDMFSAITPRYDLLNAVLSMGLDRGWRRRMVDLAALSPGGRALDVCTGTGDVARLLADAVGPGGRVVGVDFCEAMLVRAREKFPPERFPQMTFLQGDAMRLPLEDATFEAATMACGLRNLEDPMRAFRELRRVVAPGGRILILELTRPTGVLKAFYYPYLFGVLPMVGGLLSGNVGAYRYLARSIAAFLPVDRLLRDMAEAGLRDVGAIPLLGGVATILRGTV